MDSKEKTEPMSSLMSLSVENKKFQKKRNTNVTQHLAGNPNEKVKEDVKFGEVSNDFHDLYKRILVLPPDVQDYVSGLSSLFLEADVYKDFKSDVNKVVSLRKTLIGEGLNEEDVATIMDFFSFSSTPKTLDPQTGKS